MRFEFPFGETVSPKFFMSRLFGVFWEKKGLIGKFAKLDHQSAAMAINVILSLLFVGS